MRFISFIPLALMLSILPADLLAVSSDVSPWIEIQRLAD